MRIAETPPAYCSGCFQSKPDLSHVDFDVAWDGPTVVEGITNSDGELSNRIAVTIDDLILCVDCVCAAAAHAGMVDPDVQTAELEQLRAANQTLVEKLRGLEEYANRMEAAVAAKPQATAKRQKAKVG